MPRSLHRLALALAAALVTALPACRARGAEPAAPAGPRGSGAALEVMTFNLRYGTASDGEDRWELRQEHVLDVIAAEAPDLLAVQEALDFQADLLEARFPHYAKVGQHREGGRRNEFSGMFVDARRLRVEASGDLWLSETPEVVASVGWDAALTRNATWARLADRATGARFLAISTHFDHVGAEARLQSARLLTDVLLELRRAGAAPGAPPLPGLLLGDLNAGEGSAPIAHLRSAGLLDTFRVLHPDAAGPLATGTFTGFRPEPDDRKIDYVWATADWRVQASAILRPRRDGHAASDHDPVTARLSLDR